MFVRSIVSYLQKSIVVFGVLSTVYPLYATQPTTRVQPSQVADNRDFKRNYVRMMQKKHRVVYKSNLFRAPGVIFWTACSVFIAVLLREKKFRAARKGAIDGLILEETPYCYVFVPATSEAIALEFGYRVPSSSRNDQERHYTQVSYGDIVPVMKGKLDDLIKKHQLQGDSEVWIKFPDTTYLGFGFLIGVTEMDGMTMRQTVEQWRKNKKEAPPLLECAVCPTKHKPIKCYTCNETCCKACLFKWWSQKKSWPICKKSEKINAQEQFIQMLPDYSDSPDDDSSSDDGSADDVSLEDSDALEDADDVVAA